MIDICSAWWTSTNTFGPLYWCLPYRLVRGAHSVLISYHFPQQALWILDASLHPSKKYLGIFAHTCIATFTEILHGFKIELQERVLQKCFLLILILIENRNVAKLWLYFNTKSSSTLQRNGYGSISLFLKFISEIIIEISFMGLLFFRHWPAFICRLEKSACMIG